MLKRAGDGAVGVGARGRRRGRREVGSGGVDAAALESRQEVLLQVMQGCRRNYRSGRKRPSYSHPMLKELFAAFSSLESDAETEQLPRAYVWKCVARQVKLDLDAEDSYFEDVDMSLLRESDQVQIKKDLDRSGMLWDNPEDRAEMLAELEHVLCAVAVAFPHVGYCQGMNLFAATFLSVTLDTEAAFWLVVHVTHATDIAPEYYSPGMVGLKKDMWVIQELMQKYLPDLVTHFRACELDTSFTYIFVGPLLSMFGSVLNPEPMRVLMDVLLTNGVTTLFAAWLSFFKINQPYLMAQTEPSALLDTLNHALETWGSHPTFRRSLLQWCMVLDTKTIADFRSNAPSHFFNTEMVLQAAQDHANSISRMTSESSSILSRQKRSLSAARPFSSAYLPNFSQQVRARTMSDRDSIATAPPPSSLNLTIVWIASNLRKPFQCADVEEYRIAAVDICKEILRMNGYCDILAKSPPDDGAAHPSSFSTLLPNINNMVNGTRRMRSGMKVSSSPPLSPGECCKELVDDTKQGMDLVEQQSNQLWRIPEGFLSSEALLLDLMAATRELQLETCESDMVSLKLEHLRQALQTCREKIPMYRHSTALVNQLVELLTPTGNKSSNWKAKLVSAVFRGGRKASLTKKATASKGGAPQKLTESNQAQAPALLATGSPKTPSLRLRRLSSSSTGSNKMTLKEKQVWKHHVVALFLASKLHAENETVGLYLSLDSETSRQIADLLETIREDLTARVNMAIARAENPVSKTNMPVIPQNIAKFSAAFAFELGVWSLDSSASLYSGRWMRARALDIRSGSEELEMAQHNRGRSSPLGVRKANLSPPLPPKPHKLQVLSRSHSVPYGLHRRTSETAPLVPPKSLPKGELCGLDLEQARKLAQEESQRNRGLYWALRCNYHVVLDMQQFTELISGDLGPVVTHLVDILHGKTYKVQESLSESARVEFVVSQLQKLRALQDYGGAPSAAQVLLEDLEGQINLVSSRKWRKYLDDQLLVLEEALIL